jgi:proteasome accessory factor C
VARDDQKIERLTDLILVLLDASTPIPLSTLAEEIPGYPPAGEARRMAFERDKKLLREEGIVVEAVSIDGPEQFGYRIDPRTFFLPDLGLAPDEQAALNLAVAGVHLADDSGGDALRKLGFVELSDVQPVASLAVARGLDRIFQAISTSAEVRFSYRGEEREVTPVRLHFSGGHWYLSGWSHERGAGRNFRVDRIDGFVTVGAAGSGVLAPEQTVALDAPDEPWVSPDSPTPATELMLLVDPLYAWRVTAEVGDGHLIERRSDGSVVLKVSVGREEAARSWVLSYLDHVEVIEPASFRRSLLEWLDAIVDARRTESVDVTLADFEGAVDDHDHPDGAVPPTQRRLRRLLGMLEWLASAGTVPTSEVAARFAMTEAEVVAELELAACCGRPPFSPGELMDIIVDADLVTARLPEMSRPRQLTPAEGVALSAAARTILALPGSDGDGPLARALAKLDRALGERRSIEVAMDRPVLLDVLSSATANRRRLEVEYLATSTDELTRRIIDPLRVSSVDGRWYLEAFCHRAQAIRTFRIDSFKSTVDVGPQDTEHELGPSDLGSFVPAADADVAIVRVEDGAHWLIDSIPILGKRSEEDGSTLIALAVSGPAWLDRIMLQAGAHAVVVSPPTLIGAPAGAAGRVRERYAPTM